MIKLVVEHPGMQTTVQDLGRPGYGPMGVSPSGAADAVSLRLANLLVGNPAEAAALEMTLLGGSYVFPEGGVIALAGADFGASLNGRALETAVPHAVMPGGKLSLGQTRSGARCYLGIAGGVRVAPVLGSASTHLLSGSADSTAARCERVTCWKSARPQNDCQSENFHPRRGTCFSQGKYFGSQPARNLTGFWRTRNAHCCKASFASRNRQIAWACGSKARRWPCELQKK